MSDWSPVPEAESAQSESSGEYPTSAGWFVRNMADMFAVDSPDYGSAIMFDGSFSGGGQFAEFGANVRVLGPGQRAAVYHRERHQELFVVLSGTCRLIVEDEERELRQWDVFHCPAGTAHIIVGPDQGTCAVLMVGGRGGDREVLYPTSAAAARYAAAVQAETSSAAEAYAGAEPPHPAKVTWPPPA